MKNVAIINTCDWGSTGKIAIGLYNYLIHENYNAYFCYGRGKKPTNKNSIRIDSKFSIILHYLISRVTGVDGYGSRIVTKRLVSKLRKHCIDTVYIISLHGHYLNENTLFDYLCEDKIHVVYIMIDEYPYMGACTYGNGCQGIFNKCDGCGRINKPIGRLLNMASRRYSSKFNYYRKLSNPVFVGPEFTIKSCKQSPIMENLKTVIVDEAIDTDFFSPRDVTEDMQKMGIGKEKVVIVCIAPYSYKRKGVEYYYDLAKSLEDDGRFVFVHVGYDGNDKEFPSNLVVFGYEHDQEALAHYYSMADLFVFPSLSDTMPNACLEALSCGSPLLCFNTSGMPYIADDSVATFVSTGDVAEMKAVVQATQKKTEETISMCRNYALSRYDNKKYFKKLESLGEKTDA